MGIKLDKGLHGLQLPLMTQTFLAIYKLGVRGKIHNKAYTTKDYKKIIHKYSSNN